MDEVLEMIADAVSSLVLAIRESEENNTIFGDMVLPAEAIGRGTQCAMVFVSFCVGCVVDLYCGICVVVVL